MTGTHASIEDRFWRQIRKTSSCWLWTGYHARDGYGRIRIAPNGPKSILTGHRLSWEIHNGAIPDGLHVLHKCDVKLCVNPDHLFLGTHQDNMEDCRIKGRRPVMYGTKNGGSKIDEAIVLLIRKDKRSVRTIAKIYGVGKSMVSNIKRRVNWKHLEEEYR